MPRCATLALILLFAAAPVLAETVTGKGSNTPPPVTNGTSEMKWKKTTGVYYMCKVRDQICICRTNSEVFDCRKARPPEAPKSE